MKNKIIDFVLFVAMLFFIVSPLVFWFKNPELTQMQVFKQTWLDTLFAIIFAIGFSFRKK